MIWSIWHKWRSGAQFTFDFYRHWATLVVRYTGDDSGHFLHSKEGVTQGDPLTIIVYGIEVLTLIREFQGEPPRVTHLWYADDAGAEGKFHHILAHLRDMQERGSPRG